MEKTLEQRYAVKFCVKLNKTPKDTYDILQEKKPWTPINITNRRTCHPSARIPEHRPRNECSVDQKV
ncbi:hypothetical protein NQ318_017836 [Aromia moschata]|uniref:Uncharacterized protein n=1 Tax=Aromia moschata TaxID=1265417 RepID=A0AAV8YEH2_9CUCU|nr:hypothetical protein NQ318_017836 [Aromia moschata]